uniref:Acyltransferase 3 domain-containing protein n=1 Tax=Setaria digitata TaxID=48799 RepID=A0A915PEQ1_9BILA
MFFDLKFGALKIVFLVIHSYLSAYDTLKEQREFFYESYGTSESAKLLISRDRHHWRYRYLQCINVAGETKTTVSEYPFMYCYAYDNLKSNSPVIGLCLPTPCSPDKFELARHWARSMGSTNITTFKKVQCGESRDNTQWYERPFVVANYFINKVLILILACSTIYHIKRGIKSKSFARNLFLAFSTLRNFRTITQKPKKQEITCIYGLRVIGTAWVILGHSSMIIQGFLKNLEEYRDTVVNNFLYQVVTNCFLSVDLFFLLSGTLIMHSWLQSKQKKDETSSFSYWLCFYWNRIVRLWPTLLFSIIYIPIDTAVFLHRPPWRFEDPAKNCAKDWWKNLLFINSIIESNCLPWTWYIGTDFILYLISPIYLLTFKKSRELGLTISVATVVVCAILNIITARKYNFPPTQFVWNVPPIFNPDYMEHYYTDYTKPQSRIGSYIVGLLLGYHLATSDGKLSQRKVLYGWLLSAILGFISLFGLYPSLQGWHWWSYHLFYTAFHRTAWAIAVAWLIFSCHSGYANYLNRFLSSPFFVFVSKTCYTVFLSTYRHSQNIK